MGHILVIGSSNTDMVISVDEIPVPGQTVLGDSFRVFGGGKGANQAIAARRAGALVRFLVSVGDDPFGKAALDSYRREGIDTSGAQVLADTPSGVALVFVGTRGENCIGVAPGANAHLGPEYIDSMSDTFTDARLLLMQLEIPMGAVQRATEIAAERGIRVLLNPAPAASIPDALMRGLYCLTPNESETEQLTGKRVERPDDAEQAADALLERGVRNVIITLGESGAFLKGEAGTLHVPAPSVDVVDTTAAGDTFNGILAAALGEGLQLPDAVHLAVRGASLSVSRRGAADSIPHRDEYA